ncbi:unnamed protein product [Miscanthus lutarioriparius]|uniref:Fe2OG dioxygenase domain-containing protein n=1 Tax=Miscanthus lutarioriparius TaxID=422564 RepID=A0A811SKQ9_9POAL|nr:unnamed protein product [Miscanthus lutarioriparius]
MVQQAAHGEPLLLQPQPPPSLVFDAARLSGLSDIPQQFLWPADESPTPDAAEELPVPLIDLSGDAAEVVRQVRRACDLHGFFQVVNHGIDDALLQEAHRCMDAFFTLPLSDKQRAQRRQGDSCGYASSFTGRFASKLPWKETLSFRYSAAGESDQDLVVAYFVDKLGEEYRHHGEVYGRYCSEMSRLSLELMEVLGESLGVGRRHFRRFFQGSDSIMRLNYYPACQRPYDTLGTGPHCDPTSLTILHQDDVGGLQVFDAATQSWRSIRPPPGRLRRQHRRHLHGALQRPLQELPPPRRRQQPGAPPVARLLPVPGDGQGGAPARGAGGRRQPEGVPGLHVADAAGLHHEALQVRHEDARGILQLAHHPWRTPPGLITSMIDRRLRRHPKY